MSCDALEEALVRSKNALAEASRRQKNKRTTDGFGNVLLIPGLMSLAKDSREAVALYKGEVEVITRELDTRDCEYDPSDSEPNPESEADSDGDD